MIAENHSRRTTLVVLMAFVLTFVVSACIASDEPMVLSSEGEAVQEGAVAPATPGVEPPIEVEEADVAALATGEATTEAENATPVPGEEGGEGAADGEEADDTGADEGLAAEVGFTDVLVSANFLVNRDVQNPNGDEIADVDDVLIDINTGQILYLIVNYGDFLDLTTEDRPLPLSAFGWNEEFDLVLKVPEDTLASVPAVEDEWPFSGDVEWNNALSGYWQETEFAPTFEAEAVPVRVTTLVGIHAGQLGPELGVVEDLLFDLNRQQVAYLGIYATDDFYDPDLVLLVPYAAAELGVETVGDEATYSVAMLEIDPEILRSAPALDRSIFNTVDFIDQSFTAELNAFWNEQGFGVEDSQ